MSHYKENINKNNFLPQKNTKKKKKFTKSQVIVFIFMIFWSICSILGSLGFAFTVAKAEENTIDTSTESSNYNPPELSKIVYGNDIFYPTNNLLYMPDMVNEKLIEDDVKYSYKLYKDINGYSNFYTFPFVLKAGTYTITLDNFVPSTTAYTQISLQFITATGINLYARFHNNTLTPKTVSATLELSYDTFLRCRFVMANNYEDGIFFSFSNPRMNFSNTSQNFVPCFLEYISPAILQSYNLGYNDGVIDGQELGVERFKELYGLGSYEPFKNATAEIHAYKTESEYFIFDISSFDEDILIDQGFNFNAYLTNENNIVGFVPLKIEVKFYPNTNQPYDIYPLSSFNFVDKPFHLYKSTPLSTYLVGSLFTSLSNSEDFKPISFYNYYSLQAPSSAGSYYPNVSYDYIDILFYPGEDARLFYVDFVTAVSYDYGYDIGYQQGIASATSSQNYINALNQAREEGRIKGYNQGVEASNKYTFLGLMSAVIESPINAVVQLFDFELLGFNMKSIYLSILTCSILIFIIKRIV